MKPPFPWALPLSSRNHQRIVGFSRVSLYFKQDWSGGYQCALRWLLVSFLDGTGIWLSRPKSQWVLRWKGAPRVVRFACLCAFFMLKETACTYQTSLRASDIWRTKTEEKIGKLIWNHQDCWGTFFGIGMILISAQSIGGLRCSQKLLRVSDWARPHNCMGFNPLPKPNRPCVC